MMDDQQRRRVRAIGLVLLGLGLWLAGYLMVLAGRGEWPM